MKDTKDQKMFDGEIMAVVCSALLDSGKSLNSYYDLMAKVDGTKTAVAYQHRFREVLKRAREIQKQVQEGELGEAPVGKSKGGKKATPKSASKRGADEMGSEADIFETPTKQKKVKMEVNEAN